LERVRRRLKVKLRVGVGSKMIIGDIYIDNQGREFNFYPGPVSDYFREKYELLSENFSFPRFLQEELSFFRNIFRRQGQLEGQLNRKTTIK